MEQFTASEVRCTAAAIEGKQMLVSSMLRAFADLLEAREKAVPVVWVSPDDLANPYFVGIGAAKAAHQDLGRHYTQPLYTHPAPSDAAKRDTMTPRELAKRIERGEKWKLADERTPCQSQDAERLAEALRAFDGSFLKELADLVSFPEDDRGCINRSFVMERVVGLRRCWDKLSATRASSAKAQPPAASVPGVSAQAHENAQTMLAAQENPNG